MNTKNRLIEKLLKVAKKHKILTYPVLALVALISIFSYFFDWSTGAGKRVVAVVMVMVMLVSQSYFLTSSATEVEDTVEMNSTTETDETEVTENTEATDSESEETVTEEDYASDSSEAQNTEQPADLATQNADSQQVSSDSSEMPSGETPAPDGGNDVANISTSGVGPIAEQKIDVAFYLQGSSTTFSQETVEVKGTTCDLTSAKGKADATLLNKNTTDAYYTYDGWYKNPECTEKVEEAEWSNYPYKNSGIALYAKRTIKKYKVTLNINNKKDCKIEKVDGASAQSDGQYVYEVEAQDLEGEKTATFTIINPTIMGYKLVNVTGGDSNVKVTFNAQESSPTITVTLTGNDSDHVLNFKWEAQEYSITYATDESGSNIVKQQVKYDSETLCYGKNLDRTKAVVELGGYRFNGWKVDSSYTITLTGIKSTIPLAENGKVQDYLFEHPETVLKPDYTYVGIDAYNDGKKLPAENAVLRYQYSDKVNTIITGEYKEGNGDKNFTYTISSGEEDLAEVGLTAEETTKGITLSTTAQGLTNVKTEGIELQYKITDNTQRGGEAKQESTFTLKIYIDKKEVQFDPKSNPVFTKTYDGTIDCKIKDEERKLATEIKDITVTFESGVYDNKNAGENKDITLTGVKVEYGNDTAQKYTVNVDSNKVLLLRGVGTITPRRLTVKTVVEYKYNRPYARTGEADNPTRSVVVDEKANRPEDEGLVKGENLEDIVEIVDKSERVDMPTRDDLKMLEENIASVKYNVIARRKDDSKGEIVAGNYYVVQNSAENSGRSGIATYEVRLDPINENDYEIQGPISEDGWYKDSTAKIVPTGGEYDKARTKTDGLDGRNEIVLTQENTSGGHITFQLKNSSTGAFSAYKTIEVHVDKDAPEYRAYRVVESGPTSNPGDGFYFPAAGGSVSFGHFYNRTITIEVDYEDALSGPKMLHYTLSGNLGSHGSAEQTVLFEKADENGVATAKIETIDLTKIDKSGEISFYAEDKAGLVSPTMKLEENGSEWAVEQTGPAVSDISVVAVGRDKGVVTVVNGSNKYYSHCTASVHVSDATSGISGINWKINGEVAYSQTVNDFSKKQNDYDFSIGSGTDNNLFAEDGKYTVSAVVWDNAKNFSMETKSFTFMVDNVAPWLDVTEDYDVYSDRVKVKFKTYDELSGVSTIEVYGPNGERFGVEELKKQVNGYTEYDCYFETDKSGTYQIVITDAAGNQTEEEIVLDKVSSEKPECPTVTFIPDPNENGWITAKDAVARITNVTETLQDKMKAYTYYKISSDSRTEQSVIKEGLDSLDLPLPEGQYMLHVWSESRTGVMCDGAEEEENASHYYALKVDATAPEIEYQVQKETKNKVKVIFTVTDAVSGVDKKSIHVFNGKEPCAVTLKESDNGNYSGSFDVTEAGNYKIQATDLAGNEADEQAFTPMSIKVSAVKHITEQSATVGAKIFAGTFGIKNVSISYRKNADTVYTEADVVSVADEAGNMAVSAVLSDLESGTDYVYKITAVSNGNEVVEYEGYFRTLSDADQGVTISGTARYADDKTGIITVSLIKGSNYVRSVDIDMEEGTDFIFNNVSNGSYNLMATDGVYTRTIRVVVENGKLVYPEDEMIELVLNGLNTTVEVQSKETPDVSAEFSDLEDLLDEEDNQIIDAGGTVEYKLTAKLIRVTDIATGALSAMYSAAGTNKIVGAYLDLNLYKIVTDEEGNVSKKKVSKLGGGANVSVTIPLGDLADKQGLTVVRIHQNGDNYTGKQLTDMDNNPATYTVITTQFSTYAVLYDKPQESSQDPHIPTTSYQGKDVVNSNNQQTLDQSADAVKIPAKTTTAKSTTTSSSAGSLKNYSSAKTGDEAPVAAVSVMLIMAMGGLVILRRKTR